MDEMHGDQSAFQDYRRQLAAYHQQQRATVEAIRRSNPTAWSPNVARDITNQDEITPAPAVVSRNKSSDYDTTTITVTSEEQRDSFESARTSPMTTPPLTVGASTPSSKAASPVAVVAEPRPKRTKSRGSSKGILRIFRRISSGSDRW